MADINSINSQPVNTQSSYFAATQLASQQAALQAKKTEKPNKPSFSSTLKKNQEISQLISEGFPPEIAGMSETDAIVFLKDALDIASEELKRDQSLASMENFRKKCGQFMKFIVKNNFQINKEKLSPRLRNMKYKKSGRPIDPKIQIQIIDQSLNRLANEMLLMNKRGLELLAKVEEINGMIIDLLAE